MQNFQSGGAIAGRMSGAKLYDSEVLTHARQAK